MPRLSAREIKQLLNNVPGGVGTSEISLLYGLAKNATNSIVEIGSWKGRSTICLGLGARDGSGVKVYAIDPHTGSPDQLRHGRPIWSYDEFMANISNANLNNYVLPILKTSDDVLSQWKEPVSIVFIDADYDDYELTRHNISKWSKHLIDGGVIALHNTQPSFRSIFEHIPLFGRIGSRTFMINDVYNSKQMFIKQTGGAISVIGFKKNNNLFNKVLNLIYRHLARVKYFLLKLYFLIRKAPKPLKKILRSILPH